MRYPSSVRAFSPPSASPGCGLSAVAAAGIRRRGHQKLPPWEKWRTSGPAARAAMSASRADAAHPGQATGGRAGPAGGSPLPAVHRAGTGTGTAAAAHRAVRRNHRAAQRRQDDGSADPREGQYVDWHILPYGRGGGSKPRTVAMSEGSVSRSAGRRRNEKGVLGRSSPCWRSRARGRRPSPVNIHRMEHDDDRRGQCRRRRAPVPERPLPRELRRDGRGSTEGESR